MDIVFGQLHLLMLGTELEAVPADTVSFELCIYSYLRASCVHSDRVCRLYSFIINVLLLFECRWSHSLQILLHVRNNVVYGLALHEFSEGQVDRAATWCLGGHRFKSCQGLRFFLCPFLVTCSLIHFHSCFTKLKIYHLSFFQQ